MGGCFVFVFNVILDVAGGEVEGSSIQTSRFFVVATTNIDFFTYLLTYLSKFYKIYLYIQFRKDDCL